MFHTLVSVFRISFERKLKQLTFRLNKLRMLIDLSTLPRQFWQAGYYIEIKDDDDDDTFIKVSKL